jgi:hypothetical protein
VSRESPGLGNDGVVTVDSAQYGIHMGTTSRDHFHWSRTTDSRWVRFKRWATGTQPEPLENFYFMWFDWLRMSGY